MRKILLIGKNGQVGWELQRVLLSLGELVTLDYPDIDLGKPQLLRSQLSEYKADLIINAAAYTNVDKAESEPDVARAVNAYSVGELAEVARSWRAPLVHFSTDYIFNGDKGVAYVEDDIPQPINVYGQTKLEGENALQEVGGAFWIFRTAWVYSLRQGGFVQKVLKWAREQDTLRIVDDQISNPTWSRLLAEVVGQALAAGRGDWSSWVQEKKGIYHLAGGGYCSRYEWAQAILHYHSLYSSSISNQLIPVKTSEFPSLAIRPLFSVLSCEKIAREMKVVLPSWKKSLDLLFSDGSR